jgi:methylase of polypeptide subunit release factors
MKLQHFLFDVVLGNRVLSSLIWNRGIHARIWRVPVHRRVIAVTWDMTSLCMKRALDDHCPGGRFRFLDMGCGQVALFAQYVKTTHPGAVVTAVDLYDDFAATSRFNVERNGLAIDVRTGDLFDGLDGTFDLIAANPPYYPEPEHVTHDYARARYAGPDGTDAIRRFLEQAPAHLAPSGKVLLGFASTIVPLSRCSQLAEAAGFTVESVVRRRLNPARVLVLRVAH